MQYSSSWLLVGGLVVCVFETNNSTSDVASISVGDLFGKEAIILELMHIGYSFASL